MYAVVDLETTGLSPNHHHRIAEIAVVHVDDAGRVESQWCTLVNPERDLGPQRIHGIRARDVLSAPKFADIAGYVAEMLAGRMLVAHNLVFELRFLEAEFARVGVDVPVDYASGLCTMRLAGRLIPESGRGLVDCCDVAGVELDAHHAALADAIATAGLLSYLMTVAGAPPPWHRQLADCRNCVWPPIESRVFTCCTRTNGLHPTRERDFVGDLVAHMPRVDTHELADPYLAVLDQALSDRYLSADEVGALTALAHYLRLDEPTLTRLHADYLDAMARVAMADQVLTDAERADLRWVAEVLGLGAAAVDSALERAGYMYRGATARRALLAPGSRVVFTGEMDEAREVWESRAIEHGLLPHHGVTKDVQIVVAADTYSLSGKARKARGYGIPIVDVDEFKAMLSHLPVATS